MPEFRYEAFSQNGVKETGEVNAPTEADALNILSSKGLVTVGVAEIAKGTSANLPWYAREITLSGRVVTPPSHVAQFFRSLALMLENGLALRDAFGAAIETVSDARFNTFLKRAMGDLDQGATLTQALTDSQGRLPDRFLRLIQIGEESNRLATTSSHIAAMAEREKKLSDEIRSALIYPIILLAASVLVIFGLIFFLAPTLAPVFTAVQRDPPATIQAFVAIGIFIETNYALIALGIVGIVLLVKSAPARLHNIFRGLAMKLPIVGDYYRLRAAALSFNTIAMMLESGAALLSAIIAAKQSAETPNLSTLLAECEEAVRTGGSLSDALATTKLLPRDAIAFVKVGERSNQLGALLTAAATEFESRLQRKVADLMALLTPLLTLLIGGLIGLLMFSTLSAVLEINEIAFQ